MIVDNLKNSYKPPEMSVTASDAINGNSARKKGEESVDFDKVLSESNKIKQDEINKEKNALGSDGTYHVGETKNDKDFREQLEKITGKRQEKSKNALTKDDYLTLLVTQLKYQDPGKPIENHEMAAQMAQFNTVEQLVGVNKSLADMNKLQSDTKTDKLLKYIGKYVEVSGNTLRLDENKKTNIARFTLPNACSNTIVEIKDQEGKVIQNLNLGSLSAGSHNVIWNGKTLSNQDALPGQYTFHVVASTEDGKTSSAKTSFVTKVEGVSDMDTGGKIETILGKLDPSQIMALKDYESLKLEKLASQNQGGLPDHDPKNLLSQNVHPSLLNEGALHGN